MSFIRNPQALIKPKHIREQESADLARRKREKEERQREREELERQELPKQKIPKKTVPKQKLSTLQQQREEREKERIKKEQREEREKEEKELTRKKVQQEAKAQKESEWNDKRKEWIIATVQDMPSKDVSDDISVFQQLLPETEKDIVNQVNKLENDKGSLYFNAGKSGLDIPNPMNTKVINRHNLYQFRRGKHFAVLKKGDETCTGTNQTLPIIGTKDDTAEWPWDVNVSFEDPVHFKSSEGNQYMKACYITTNKWMPVYKESDKPNAFFSLTGTCKTDYKQYKQTENTIKNVIKQLFPSGNETKSLEMASKTLERLSEDQDWDTKSYSLVSILNIGQVIMTKSRLIYNQKCIVRGDKGHQYFLDLMTTMQGYLRVIIQDKMGVGPENKNVLLLLQVFYYIKTNDPAIIQNKIRTVLWYLLIDTRNDKTKSICNLFLYQLISSLESVAILTLIPDLTTQVSGVSVTYNYINIPIVTSISVDSIEKAITYLSQYRILKEALNKKALSNKVTFGIENCTNNVASKIFIFLATKLYNVAASCLINMLSTKSLVMQKCVITILYTSYDKCKNIKDLVLVKTSNGLEIFNEINVWETIIARLQAHIKFTPNLVSSVWQYGKDKEQFKKYKEFANSLGVQVSDDTLYGFKS